MCCRIVSVDGKLVCCGATIHIGILPFGWFCTALGKLCSLLYHSCQPRVTNHHIILEWLTSLENMVYSWEKCFLNVYKLLVLEFRLSPLLSVWAHYIGKGSIGIQYTLYRYMEEEMAPHSSTFARKIPWRRSPVGYIQSMGSQRVGRYR